MKIEKNSPKAFAVLAAIFLFIVLGFYIFYEVVTGVCLPLIFNTALKNTTFKNCTESVTAEVTDVQAVTSSRYRNGHTTRTYSFQITYSYEYMGSSHNERSSVSADKKIHSEGDSAEILLDPNDPSVFYDPLMFRLPLAGTVIRLSAAAVHLAVLAALIGLAVKKARNKLKGEQYA